MLLRLHKIQWLEGGELSSALLSVLALHHAAVDHQRRQNHQLALGPAGQGRPGGNETWAASTCDVHSGRRNLNQNNPDRELKFCVFNREILTHQICSREKFTLREGRILRLTRRKSFPLQKWGGRCWVNAMFCKRHPTLQTWGWLWTRPCRGRCLTTTSWRICWWIPLLKSFSFHCFW